MDFGGPVWHASAKAATEEVAWGMVERALRNAGDSFAGEWREVGNSGVVHLRRRLARWEQGAMTVRDIRGTPEETYRLKALIVAAPYLDAPGLRTEP